MTQFWALYHHHITCELIPAVLVMLALASACWHDRETRYRKKIAYKAKVLLFASLASGLASGHPFSPLIAMVPFAVFGAAILLDSVVYILRTPEQTPPDTPPADVGEAKTKEGGSSIDPKSNAATSQVPPSSVSTA